MKRKFLRQNWFRYKKLGKKWRRPRGRHSKMRTRRKGKPPRPSIGYKKQKEIRGTVQGFKPILISNVNDLDKIKIGEAIIISSRVGLKKALEISKKAEDLGIKILNPRKIRKAEKISRKIKMREEKMKK